MVRTTPFTSHEEFTGTPAYTALPSPNPNAPSIRSQALPPVVAPARAPVWGWRKTATSPAADPSNFAAGPALKPLSVGG